MRTRRVKRPSLRAQALALLLTAVLTSAALAAPQIWGYQEGLAKAAEGGLWGFANVAGEIVIPIQYQSVMDWGWPGCRRTISWDSFVPTAPI